MENAPFLPTSSMISSWDQTGEFSDINFCIFCLRVEGYTMRLWNYYVSNDLKSHNILFYASNDCSPRTAVAKCELWYIIFFNVCSKLGNKLELELELEPIFGAGVEAYLGILPPGQNENRENKRIQSLSVYGELVEVARLLVSRSPSMLMSRRQIAGSHGLCAAWFQ